MKYMKSALLAASAVIVSIGAQGAPADPRVTSEVVPVAGNNAVTLSRLATSKKNLALDTLAAYQFTISNGTTNTLNRVFLSGTATNVGGTDPVLFDSSIPSGCTAGNAPNKVICSVASLPPGATSPPLIVIFRAPTNGTAINFNWTAGGDEGNGGGNGCCNQVGVATTALIDPTTDETYKFSAKTFVKRTGGKVFTGKEAITTPSDGWSTTVEVPAFDSSPLGQYTLATISEQQLGQSCKPYVTGDGCFASELTIPGSFASLKISFQWDKSFFNLGNGPNGIIPADVRISYQQNSTSSINTVNLCSYDLANLPVGVMTAPSPGKPCMPVPPKLLKNTDTPVKESWGDLFIQVEALDNGKYNN